MPSNKSGHWRILVSTGERVPKRHYSRSEAIERAARMSIEYGRPYHVYACLHPQCWGRHVGRPPNRRRPSKRDQLGKSIRIDRDYFLDMIELGIRVAGNLQYENLGDRQAPKKRAIKDRWAEALSRRPQPPRDKPSRWLP